MRGPRRTAPGRCEGSKSDGGRFGGGRFRFGATMGAGAGFWEEGDGGSRTSRMALLETNG